MSTIFASQYSSKIFKKIAVVEASLVGTSYSWPRNLRAKLGILRGQHVARARKQVRSRLRSHAGCNIDVKYLPLRIAAERVRQAPMMDRE